MTFFLKKGDKNASVDSFKPKKQPLVNKKDKKAASIDESQVQPSSSAPNPQEDAQIRSALYGVLVQIYMDRHSWHSALDVIDSALQVLPRTHHRLLLYKYRVLIKSKLGLSISMDMQKFREQGELALARMWRQVALMAKRRDHVINAFQRAIETLQVNDLLSLFISRVLRTDRVWKVIGQKSIIFSNWLVGCTATNT